MHNFNALGNNDLVKFTSSRGDNLVTNGSMVMKIAHAELYTTSNIVCNFDFSTCNTVGLFLYNNSAKFTSSREDSSTTNNRMIIKNCTCKTSYVHKHYVLFQSSICKTVGEKLQTKLCPRTDGRRAMAIPVYPFHFVMGGV